MKLKEMSLPSLLSRFNLAFHTSELVRVDSMGSFFWC